VSGREYTILAEAGERGKEWEGGGGGGGVRDSARRRSVWGEEKGVFVRARDASADIFFDACRLPKNTTVLK